MQLSLNIIMRSNPPKHFEKCTKDKNKIVMFSISTYGNTIWKFDGLLKMY